MGSHTLHEVNITHKIMVRPRVEYGLQSAFLNNLTFALLSWHIDRSTPISVTGCSPAELIMSRKIRNAMPIKPAKVSRQWPDLKQVFRKDTQTKLKMKGHFNMGHGARTLNPLGLGDKVRINIDKNKLWEESGIITSADYRNGSYGVQTIRRTFRLNRRHILLTGLERNTR